MPAATITTMPSTSYQRNVSPSNCQASRNEKATDTYDIADTANFGPSKHGGCTENSHRNGEILNEHAEVEQMYVESKKEPKKARFCKPTISEVQEYCYARQNLVDAERFYNYYESNGWKVGKNPMKDWKACVRTWERNGYDTKTNVNQYGTNTDANNEPKFGRMPASEVAKSISGWGD